eukprot:2087490-Prorocentrum_lima.AAC.1
MESPLQCRRFGSWLGPVEVRLVLLCTARLPLAVHAARVAQQGCRAEQAVEPQCARVHAAVRAPARSTHGQGWWALRLARRRACADVEQGEA